jgi:hypothetical protein
MLAYHNDPQLKQQILEQLQRYYDAEEIVREKCRDDGKGFSMSSIFKLAENFNTFGIPVRLAYLEDAIFEGLPNDLAKNWPMRFMSAINVGADLSTIWREFALWLLVDPIDGVIKYTQPGTDVYQAIMRVATLYRDGHTQQQMREAAFAAANAANVAFAAADEAAYYAADEAAYYAAYVAFAAAYVDVAAYDVRDVTYAVRDVTYAAASAYYSATTSAYYVAYVAAERDAAYTKMSNKLIELLENKIVIVFFVGDKHDHK